MYSRTNRAALIAQIGAINKPKITEGKSLDLGGAVKAYMQGREMAERRAKEQEQKNRVDAWINQLNGDETLSDTEKAYFTANPDAYGQRMANNLDFERQKELKVLDAQLAAQNASSNPFGGKNEFVSLLAIRNSPKWLELPDEDKGFITNRLNYLSNNPDAVYSKAYAGQSGKEQATAEFERAANAYASGKRVENLQDVLATVQDMDRVMFTPIGATKAKLGQIGDVFGASNLGGMSEEQRTQRSRIDRAITDIGQDLIARAKSKGQAGINTLAEIERILGSISMTGGRAELIGALQELIEQEQKLNALETIATPIPTTKTPTDKDAWGDIEE